MSAYLRDEEYLVQSGSIANGVWRIAGTVFTDGQTAIKLSKITSCVIVKDEHSTTQSGSGRIAGGILGAALLGPIGAIGGLLSGGKKRVDETIIHCGFDDNRVFTAESTQLGAASLIRISQQNQRVGAATASSTPTPSTTTDDLMECPQCAEMIKRKAKICRFCRAELNELPVPEKEQIRSSTSVADSPISKFISLYRRDVQDSPFSNDDAILWIFNEFAAMYKDDPEQGTYKILKSVAQKFDVPALDIEKVFSSYWSTTKLVNSYLKANPPGSPFGDLTPLNVRLILESLSQCRLEQKFDSHDAEEIAVIEHLSRVSEKVFHGGYVSRLKTCLPMSIISAPFYVIDDHVVCVDLATRQKKRRKVSPKKTELNAKIAKVLESREFLDWYTDNFNDDVSAHDVIRFYLGAVEVDKLSVEHGIEAYSLSEFSEMIRLFWEGDEGQVSVVPDTWLTSNFRSAIHDFNEPEEDKVDDDILIAAFERGFNSV